MRIGAIAPRPFRPCTPPSHQAAVSPSVLLLRACPRLGAPAFVLRSLASAAEPRRSNRGAGDERIADEFESNDWLAYGRTHSERRFSPLTQISDRTVGRLKPDWYLDLPNDTGLVSTPLVIDGVLYRGSRATLHDHRCPARG